MLLCPLWLQNISTSTSLCTQSSNNSPTQTHLVIFNNLQNATLSFFSAKYLNNHITVYSVFKQLTNTNTLGHLQQPPNCYSVLFGCKISQQPHHCVLSLQTTHPHKHTLLIFNNLQIATLSSLAAKYLNKHITVYSVFKQLTHTNTLGHLQQPAKCYSVLFFCKISQQPHHCVLSLQTTHQHKHTWSSSTTSKLLLCPLWLQNISTTTSLCTQSSNNSPTQTHFAHLQQPPNCYSVLFGCKISQQAHHCVLSLQTTHPHKHTWSSSTTCKMLLCPFFLQNISTTTSLCTQSSNNSPTQTHLVIFNNLQIATLSSLAAKYLNNHITVYSVFKQLTHTNTLCSSSTTSKLLLCPLWLQNISTSTSLCTQSSNNSPTQTHLVIFNNLQNATLSFFSAKYLNNHITVYSVFKQLTNTNTLGHLQQPPNCYSVLFGCKISQQPHHCVLSLQTTHPHKHTLLIFNNLQIATLSSLAAKYLNKHITVYSVFKQLTHTNTLGHLQQPAKCYSVLFFCKISQQPHHCVLSLQTTHQHKHTWSSSTTSKLLLCPLWLQNISTTTSLCTQSSNNSPTQTHFAHLQQPPNCYSVLFGCKISQQAHHCVLSLQTTHPHKHTWSSSTTCKMLLCPFFLQNISTTTSLCTQSSNNSPTQTHFAHLQQPPNCYSVLFGCKISQQAHHCVLSLQTTHPHKHTWSSSTTCKMLLCPFFLQNISTTTSLCTQSSNNSPTQTHLVIFNNLQIATLSSLAAKYLNNHITVYSVFKQLTHTNTLGHLQQPAKCYSVLVFCKISQQPHHREVRPQTCDKHKCTRSFWTTCKMIFCPFWLKNISPTTWVLTLRTLPLHLYCFPVPLASDIGGSNCILHCLSFQGHRWGHTCAYCRPTSWSSDSSATWIRSVPTQTTFKLRYTALVYKWPGCSFEGSLRCLTSAALHGNDAPFIQPRVCCSEYISVGPKRATTRSTTFQVDTIIYLTSISKLITMSMYGLAIYSHCIHYSLQHDGRSRKHCIQSEPKSVRESLLSKSLAQGWHFIQIQSERWFRKLHSGSVWGRGFKQSRIFGEVYSGTAPFTATAA